MSEAKIDRIIEKKLDTMKNQLLDTGKRNRMINYRETKRSTLRIITPDYRELFQRLVIKEESLRFQHPIDQEYDMRAYSVLTLMKTLGHEIPVRIGDIEVGAASYSDQKATLRNLRSKAKLAQEEQGTNILYLSFGFLRWREKNTNSSPFMVSPLIMVPASLTIKNLRSPFVLSKYDDEIVVNPTLAYKFDHEYNLKLPEFEAKDEKSLNRYFSRIEKIADERGWQLIREVSLGLVSFLKISMYHDLVEKHDRLITNPNIRAICGDPEAVRLPEAARRLEDLDAIEPAKQYQVIDADSSQQKAIVLSRMGASFVMQGPPGTGKSQTITNMIAEALADGKKVLFVSEKAAALEVVLRRLTEAHISEFCLSLHDYKANKRDVLEQLRKSLQMKRYAVKSTAMNDLVRLAKKREELNAYAKELHEIIQPLNMSLYQVFGELSQFSDSVDFICRIDEVDQITETEFQVMNYQVEKYVQALKEMTCGYLDNPWRGTVIKSTSTMYLADLKERTAGLPDLLRKLDALMAEPLGTAEIQGATLQDVETQIKTLAPIEKIPLYEYRLHRMTLPEQKKMLMAAKEARAAQALYQTAREETKRLFDESVLEQDAEGWIRQIQSRLAEIKARAGWHFAPDEDILKNAVQIAAQAKDTEEALKTAAADMRKIRDMARIPAGNGDLKVSELQELVRFSQAVLQLKEVPLRRWLNGDEARKAKEIIQGASKVLQTKKALWDRMNAEWQPGVREYTSQRINEQCIQPINQIFKKHAGGIDAAHLAATLEAIGEEADNTENTISKCASFATGLAERVGLGKVDTIAQLREAQEIAKFVEEAKDIPPGWLNDIRREDAFRLLAEAREQTRKYRDQLAELEREWDAGILHADAGPLISRFKTEHRGLFAHYRTQYKQDAQEILKYAKRKGISYSDDQMLQILYKVRDIQDVLRWMQMNERQLLGAFGKYYQGAGTDWARVKALLEQAGKISEAIIKTGKIPVSGMINLLRHEQESGAGSEYHQTVSGDETIGQLRRLIRNWGFEGSVDSISFEERILPNIRQTGQECKRAAGLIRTIAGRKTNPAGDLSVEQFNGLMQMLVAMEQYEKWFVEREGELRAYTRDTRFEEETFWTEELRCLEETVAAAEAIPGYLLTEEMKDLLCFKDGLQQARDLAGAMLAKYSEESIEGMARECRRFLPNGAADGSFSEIQNGLDAVRQGAGDLHARILQCNIYTKFDLPAERMLSSLEQVTETKKQKAEYKRILSENPDLVERFGERDDWSGTIRILEYVKAFTAEDGSEKYTPAFIQYFCDNPQAREEIQGRVRQLSELYDAAAKGAGEFISIFPEDRELKNASLTALALRYEQCLDHIEQLDMWLNYRDAREECIKIGLRDFVDRMEKADGKTKDPIGCFRYSFFQLWCQKVIADKPAISRFKRFTQDRDVQEFCDLDVSQFVTAQQRIRAKIIDTYPDPNAAYAAGDEMSILLRELGKKTKIMPLRRLFREIPNLLLRLKPCLMMSPLSVSYFLDADSYNFDMVIFDEASQIFPQDSLGSILRGKQVIIAGDTSQLPPTNFFAAAAGTGEGDFDDDREDEDDLPDEEISDSILEEADKVMTSSTLLWHYRSRNEQLIAFSNQEIYNQRLITFPGCRDHMEDTGVEFIYVKDGLYEGRPKNCNAIEAEKCVQMVEEHINKHPDRSLGIIAFSEKQQQAILDAIQDFREEHPKYEFFFREDKQNPFFVKNLENVQGDERDTIFFSVGYGYTKEQRENRRPMSLRFGPLGRNGGERRLNVAITRAKINIKLIASILPEDIRLDRTQSLGIRLLHDYINFAIRGTDALHMPYEEIDRDMVSCVIRDFLTENGYKVVERLGCSGYRVDLAVVHPRLPDCYLAAIECDGGSFMTAHTARERERLRKEVLERMGWNVYRVWSTEWVKNKKAEGEKLLDFLRKAEEKPFEYTEKNTNGIPESRFEDIVEAVDKTEKNEENKYGFQEYVKADPADTPPSRPGYSVTLDDHILYTILVEQPISIDLLYQRMAPILGNSKVTTRITTAVDMALAHLGDKVVRKEGFLTRTGFQNPAVRIPSGGEEQRLISHIAPEELMEAMRTVAEHSFGLTYESLVIETAKALGYQRRGARIQSVLERILDALVQRKVIHIIDGKVNSVEGSING